MLLETNANPNTIYLKNSFMKAENQKLESRLRTWRRKVMTCNKHCMFLVLETWLSGNTTFAYMGPEFLILETWLSGNIHVFHT